MPPFGVPEILVRFAAEKIMFLQHEFVCHDLGSWSQASCSFSPNSLGDNINPFGKNESNWIISAQFW